MAQDTGSKNLWVSGSKWPLKTSNAAPVPLPKPQAEFVRMKHPREHGVYYSQTEGAWVRQGWTVWTIKEWEVKFGYADNFTSRGGVDNEGRHWEFFGYRIPMKVAE